MIIVSKIQRKSNLFLYQKTGKFASASLNCWHYLKKQRIMTQIFQINQLLLVFMKRKQGGEDPERMKLFAADSTKDEAEQCCTNQLYLLKLVNCPLTLEAHIVDFYYFWWDKSDIIKEHYRRFSPQIRKGFKYKLFICRRYCKRYLGFELGFWFEYIMITIDCIAAVQLEVALDEVDSMIEDIYKTHDPNFKEPVFGDIQKKKQPPKTTKGFFSSILKKIYQRMTSKLQK